MLQNSMIQVHHLEKYKELWMNYTFHYYKCSPEYLASINPNIEPDIQKVLDALKIRNNPKNFTSDLYLILSSHAWSHRGAPTETNPQTYAEPHLIQNWKHQLVSLKCSTIDSSNWRFSRVSSAKLLLMWPNSG